MSSAGRCIACRTSSGMVVGPGMARHSRPARTVMGWDPCRWRAGHGCRLWPRNSRLAPSRFQRIRYASQDLVLQLGGGRAWNDVHRPRPLLARLDQAQDPDLAVGEIGIAAAIAPGQRQAHAGHLIFRGDHACVLEIACEVVALGVEIGIDMMGDGAGEMADADALVEGVGAEPDGAVLLALVQHFPEADMMAAVGAFARRLLECQILAPA